MESASASGAKGSADGTRHGAGTEPSPGTEQKATSSATGGEPEGGAAPQGQGGETPPDSKAAKSVGGPPPGTDPGIAPQDAAALGGGGGKETDPAKAAASAPPCVCICVPFPGPWLTELDLLDLDLDVAVPPTTLVNTGIANLDGGVASAVFARTGEALTLDASSFVVPTGYAPALSNVGAVGIFGLAPASAWSGAAVQSAGGLQLGPTGLVGGARDGDQAGGANLAHSVLGTILGSSTKTSFSYDPSGRRRRIPGKNGGGNSVPDTYDAIEDGGGGGSGAPGGLRPPAGAVGPAVLVPPRAQPGAPGTALAPGSSPSTAIVPWTDEGGGSALTRPLPLLVIVTPQDTRVLGVAPRPAARRDSILPPYSGTFAFGGPDAGPGAGVGSRGFPPLEHGFEAAGYDRELVIRLGGPAASDLPDSIDVARPSEGRIGSASLDEPNASPMPDHLIPDRGGPSPDLDAEIPGGNSPRWADLGAVKTAESGAPLVAAPPSSRSEPGQGLGSNGSYAQPSSPSGGAELASFSGSRVAAAPGAIASGGSSGLGAPQSPSPGGKGGGLGGVASAKSWSDQAQANNSAKHNVDSAKAELATAQQNVAKANKSGDEKQIKDAADAYSKALDKVADAEMLHTDAGGYDVSDEDAKKAKEEADKAYQNALDAMGGNKEQLDKLITDEQKRQETYKEWAKEREEKAKARDERHEAKKSARQALESARDTRDKNTATKNAISQVTSRSTKESKQATNEAKAAYKDAKKAEKEAKQAAKDAQRAATYGNNEQQKKAQEKADNKAKLADKKADYAKAKAEEAKIKADKKSTKAQKERAEANSARANATVKKTEAQQKRSEANAAKEKAKDARDGTTKKAQLEKEAKEKDEAAKKAEADAETADAEAKKQEGEADAAEVAENAPPPPPPCDCKPPCPPGSYCICIPRTPPGGDGDGAGDGGGKGKGPGEVVIPDDTANRPAGKPVAGEDAGNDPTHPSDGGDQYRDAGGDGDGGRGSNGDDTGGGSLPERSRRGYRDGKSPVFPPDSPHDYGVQRRPPPPTPDDSDSGGPTGPSTGSRGGAHIYAQELPPPAPKPPEEKEKSDPYAYADPYEEDCTKSLTDKERKALEDARRRREKEIAAEVGEDGDKRDWDKNKRDTELRKRLKSFYDEEAKKLSTIYVVSAKTYASSDPITGTIDYPNKKKDFNSLPLVLQVVVESHEQTHLKDFANGGALEREVNALRTARTKYDEARLAAKSQSDTDLKAASDKLEEARTKYRQKLALTECNAYWDSYRLLWAFRRCYKRYKKVLDEFKILIIRACDPETKKQRLQDIEKLEKQAASEAKDAK